MTPRSSSLLAIGGMAAGYAARPGLLRTAFKQLFSARKPDWDRFDGIFDAFWLGQRGRSRSITTGSAFRRGCRRPRRGCSENVLAQS